VAKGHRGAGPRAKRAKRHVTPKTFLERFFPYLLFAITLIAYLPALRAGYIWDDDRYVTGNQDLRSVYGLGRIWATPGSTPQYYPLVFTTFWLEYHLWGLRPFGFHLVNVLLHAGSAVLLWRLLRRLAVPGAMIAAAIFALHPVAVESVAWVTERKNTLSLLFYLLSLNLLIGWMEPTDDGEREHPRNWRGYVGAFIVYVAALLSKTVTSTMPAAALVIAWWKRGRLSLRGDIVPMLPFFAVGAGLSYMTVWMERVVVGTAERDWTLTPVQRLLTAGNAFWFYLGKLAWPADLAFIYRRWELSGSNPLHWIAPSAFLLLVVVLWALRRRITRGPLAAVLLFAGTLTPALGFFDVFPFEFSFVADHFQYHACIWMLALFAAVATIGASRYGLKQDQAHGAAVAVCAVLLVLTFNQSRAYRNAESLWRDTVAKNPTAPMPRNNLGQLLAASNRPDEAIKHYRAAIESNPNYAIAWFNLGAALAQTGKKEEALQTYAEALERDPDNAQMHYHIGLGMQRLGRVEDAYERFTRAIELKPNYVDPINDLANIFAQQGRLEDAVDKYRQVLQVKPDYVVARSNLANALATLGRSEEALQEYATAVEIDPLNAGALFNYGITLDRLGRKDEARAQIAQALKLRPGWKEAEAALQRIGSK